MFIGEETVKSCSICVVMILIFAVMSVLGSPEDNEKAKIDPASGERADWHVISSGGSSAASTNFRYSGTLSQMAVGSAALTNYRLGHGFWQGLTFGNCCGLYTGGLTGNTDCSEDGKLTLSDVVRLIDNLYISKNPLCCYASGNTNGSEDCKLTLSDVMRLIDALYISKQPTEACLPACEQ